MARGLFFSGRQRARAMNKKNASFLKKNNAYTTGRTSTQRGDGGWNSRAVAL